MIYLKSFLAGIAGAILGATLWIVVAFVVPVVGPMLAARITNTGGVASASIGSGSILLAALVGFVVAGWWALRRFRTA